MTDSIQDAVFQEIARESAHFAAAPTAFFHAWKRGVALAGTRHFGDGTHANLEQATTVWDLRPKVQLIEQAIGPMSPAEKVFMAALVSFYDAEAGGKLFKRIGFRGLSDLGGLDLKRRSVVAALIMNYNGW
jgi:hypothetical protein